MLAAWVTQATGGASARQLAQRIHRSPTSVAKWLRTGEIPAEDVIAIARAYDADPLSGLVAAGHLRKEDVYPHIRRLVSIAPATFLMDEMAARVRAWEEAAAAGREYVPTFAFPHQLLRSPDPPAPPKRRRSGGTTSFSGPLGRQ